jgi:AcrR family transcriptional regulator
MSPVQDGGQFSERVGSGMTESDKHPGGRRSLELLWKRQERPARGPKPGLSLDAIVNAAIAVVDTEGLTALTMSRVAAQLDVTTMALYRYVPGKEELIDLMIDNALGNPPQFEGRDWRTELGQWARTNLAVLQRHPWLLESIIRRVTVGPNWLAWVESALRAIANLGLDAREQLAVVVLVDGHVRSVAQISLGIAATREWAANFGEVLKRVSGDPRYAALAGAAAAGGFDQPAKGDPDTFEFGLQRLLDGIEAFSRARRAQRRRKPIRGRRESRARGGR